MTACGSTLPQTQVEAADGSVDGFEEFGPQTLPPGASINEKGQVVNAEGEVIGSASDFGLSEGVAATDPAAKGSGANVGGQGGESSLGVDGPGVTDRTIKLGLMHIEDEAAAQEQFGTSEVGRFNYKRGWEALLEYQNAQGGIAGRRIIPVYYSREFASAQTLAQQGQEACVTWTQDNRVFAALTFVWTDNIPACLSDAGTALVSLDLHNTMSITPIHQKYPTYIAPVALTLDRGAVAMVEALDEMNYFTRDQKLGLVTFDHPNFRYATDNALIPTLRRFGIALTDAVYVHYPGGNGDVPQFAGDINNAALRFKTAGIDHVIFIDSSVAAAYFFMVAAEQQDYHPRYGLSGQSGNQALADLLGGNARRQLHGALSVGWMPHLNTREKDNPDRNNPTRVRCLGIMRRAGLDVSSHNAQDGALTECDTLWTLAAALGRASVINQDSFLAGMNGLQGDYSPGAVWSTNISRARHDGVSSLANLRFVDTCTCFKYLSQPYQIP